ncbi:MAG: ATPase, T2SS/T4P/T4SS family, partial [Nitrososphaerales archaeon]
PVINTSLLPDEAPNIVTGYVRLITLGLSFFLAVYLGLEAFSLFVQFPTSLPISNLLITYGHMSNSSAAYALVGLLVAEVAAVQVWAWRTRRSSLENEEYEEEGIQSPVPVPEPVPLAADAQQPATQGSASPTDRAVDAQGPPPQPFPAAPEMPSPQVFAEQARPAPPLAAVEVAQTASMDAPPAPSAVTSVAPAGDVGAPTKAEENPNGEIQVKEQEQQSGMISQFESQELSAQGTEYAVSPADERQAPVSAPQSSEMRKQERTPPTAVGAPFVTRYQIYPEHPDVYVGIQRDPETGGFRYVVVEPKLSLWEKQVYQKLTRLLVDELEVDMAKLKNNKSAEDYLVEEAKMLAKKYKISVAPDSYKKIAYYFARDYIKLGKIEVLMNDPRIEDISCDGPGIPLFIWHKDYESIPSNVMFRGDDELNSFASKLAYVSGKHISIASPIVDATLPDGSRIQITYGREVTKKGSTFTIRKFKGDPITIVDLLKYNTLSPELGAYLWYLIEKRMSLLVAGGTASGKSVPYDEQVLVYKSGKPRLVRIGELYDEIAESEECRKEDQYEVLDTEGLGTAAFDSNLKVKRFAVKSIVRHPAEKTIFRVKTRSGREVRSTADHSVFTVLDGSVVPYPASRLTPGMYVAVPRSVPGPDNAASSLDLLALFAEQDHELYVENVAGYVELASKTVGPETTAKLLGVRSRDVAAAVKKGFLAARVSRFTRLMRRAGFVPKEGELRIRPKTNRGSCLPTTLAVSKALMRLMGYWTAEGMYQKGITIFQLNQDTRKDIDRLGREVFGLGAHENMGDRTRLDFNSTAVRALFQQLFGSGKGAGQKRIPGIVLEQSDELLAEFLRGYFTGDGWGDDYVEATTKSYELAQQLLYALARFGIVAMTNQKKVKGKTYHRVLIYGHKDLEIFAQNIGFLNKYQDRLLQSLHSGVKPHTNVDTIPGAAGLLKSALMFKSGTEKKQLWSDWHSYWSIGTGKRMGPQTMVRFLESTGAQGDVRERILDLAHSDIFWDEVAEVEQVPYDGEYVYDLEVPGPQNFVGGSGGVFLHNTTTLNALSMFIPPDQKIVSVEDTPELNLSHKNWIQSVSRGGGLAGEITLFDLLKAAMRQRPDIIIVGEVRGVEAFTLFQAIASVTGDTPVLIREGGQVKLRQIGDFVDEFYSGEEERVPKHIDGREVLSFEKSGVVTFSPVKYVLRHKADEIFVLRYAGGRVRATASHSVFVFDEDGKIVPKPVSSLASEDIMVSFCGSEFDRQQPVVDAEPILRKVEGHSVITERSRPSCPYCAAPSARLKGHMGGLQRYQCRDCSKTFREASELVFANQLLTNHGALVSFERSLTLPKTITVDEEFARVLGIYLADGCVKTHKGSSRVVFSLGSEEKAFYAQDAIRFFARYGSEPSIDDRGTYVMLEFNHSPLAEVFRELCGARLEEKRMPSFMWTAPASLVQAFLSGWEADGRRTIKGRRSVPITSVRRDLVESISWLARLNSRTTYIAERSSKYPSVYVSNAGQASRSDAIPAHLLHSLKNLLGSSAWVHMPKRSNKTISKQRAERALQEIIMTARKEMSWKAAQLISTISALIEGSLIASRVIKIEKQQFEGFVYDISVPGTEAFFGGDSPIALHNTGHGGLGTVHADSVEDA